MSPVFSCQAEPFARIFVSDVETAQRSALSTERGSTMKKVFILLVIVAACALSVQAAGPKTLARTVPAGDLVGIDLDSGVGDIEITGRDDAVEVMIDVVLTPRRGGFFSSKRQAEREVEEATLRADTRGDHLSLGISPDNEDRRFEEKWTIVLPGRLHVAIDHGVGDVELRGVSGGLEIESGVGDVLAEVNSGDVRIELGVGDASLRAPGDAYASAEASGGVGDARLSVRGELINGSGFVGKSARWTGDGSFHIEMEVGVGDAHIKLD